MTEYETPFEVPDTELPTTLEPETIFWPCILAIMMFAGLIAALNSLVTL